MNLFKTLTPEEEVEYRTWARETYDPTTEINQLWHPVTREECKQMQIEMLDGIMTLTQKNIDKIFADAKNQHEYWENLYRSALPDLDNIVQIAGWPEISEKTGSYIMLKAIEFDREHHPEVMAGGLWMNSGFSVLNKEVPDWRIYTMRVSAEYKENSNA